MVFSLRGLKKSHSLFVLVAINSTTIQSVLAFFSVSDEVTGTYHCTGVNGNGSLTAVASLQLFGESHTHSLSLSLSLRQELFLGKKGVLVREVPIISGFLTLSSYPGTPSPPLDVTLSIANQTNVNVTWKPPLDDGHLQLLGYSVIINTHLYIQWKSSNPDTNVTD